LRNPSQSRVLLTLGLAGWANGFIICPRGYNYRWASKKTLAHPTTKQLTTH